MIIEIPAWIVNILAILVTVSSLLSFLRIRLEYKIAHLDKEISFEKGLRKAIEIVRDV